mmetsp:Transcript_29835/g.85639  ORF Transcript_29835/g.85639 Transcript_29835/m.85639 type:complete len:238 (-) Transcript_29835:65-778(-)
MRACHAVDPRESLRPLCRGRLGGLGGGGGLGQRRLRRWRGFGRLLPATRHALHPRQLCVPGFEGPARSALEGVQGRGASSLGLKCELQRVPVIADLSVQVLLVNDLEREEAWPLSEPLLLLLGRLQLALFQALQRLAVARLQLVGLSLPDAADVHLRERTLDQEPHPRLFLGSKLTGRVLLEPLGTLLLIKDKVPRRLQVQDLLPQPLQLEGRIQARALSEPRPLLALFLVHFAGGD